MQKFHKYNTQIKGIPLPEKFTYPFCYDAHPLVEVAASELQTYLLTQNDFIYNFGVRDNLEGTPQGKMFGVLVVKNHHDELGYLCAFSGKLGKLDTPNAFVPPVYDINIDDSFYKIGEAKIDKMTKNIDQVSINSDYLELKNQITDKKHEIQKILENEKKIMREKKAARKIKRQAAEKELSEIDFMKLKESLATESITLQNDYKKLSLQLNSELSQLEEKYDLYEQNLQKLKTERKHFSSALQKEIFEKYQFLNINGDVKKLTEIFPDFDEQKPPGGSGDCSAPKLLQYAFINNLKPIAMGEFWWGVPPKAEIRRHKIFYPACNNRCKPILSHMLKGLRLEENPLQQTLSLEKKIEIIYEDNDLAVINKPVDLLSVPGKTIKDSVLLRAKEIFPEADGPLIVHRLDMSTSGLLVLAKTKNAHKDLQSQFLNRTIKKRYIALVEGEINEDEGEINLPLRVDLDDRPRQLVCYQHGKPARTKWKVIKREKGKTRLHLYPITGRTHQLRVHLAHHLGLNSPIIGDDLYGKKGERLCLHAEYLQFKHPTTQKKMRFTLEPDF